MKTVRETLLIIINLQPRQSGGSADVSSDEIVTNLADDFKLRLPKKIDASLAHESVFELTPQGAIISLGVFL